MTLNRRELIHVGSAIAGATLIPHFVDRAEARTLPGATVFVAEGDSITNDAFSFALGNGAPAYPGQYSAMRTSVIYHNLSVVACTLTDLQSRSPSPKSYKGQGKNVLSVLIGHNDIATSYHTGRTRAGFLSALANYLDARRSAGLKVVICTILPSMASSSFNTERRACNEVISTWVGTHADALCDFASNATMGPDAAATDTTLYRSGVHPTALGHKVLKGVIQPVLDGLI